MGKTVKEDWIEKLQEQVEFDHVAEICAGYAESEAGKAVVRALCRTANADRAKQSLAETEEAVRVLQEVLKGEPIGVFSLPSDTAFLLRFGEDVLPSKEEIKLLGDLLTSCSALWTLKGKVVQEKFPNLHKLLSTLQPVSQVAKDFKAIFSEDGEVRDSASPLLGSIRLRINRLQLEIEEKISNIIRSRFKEASDEVHLSIRNNRFTINVPTGLASLVKGITIDYSASGASIYVEPNELVALNNLRQKLLLEEELETRRVVSEFGRIIQGARDALVTNFEIIANVDAVFARARYALEIGAICPELSSAGEIALRNARHPLMLKNFVPESLDFVKEKGIVISGVNAGGKTVLLKLIALLTLMSYAGIFIPADEGTLIGLFDLIFVDVPEDQSVLNNLSTFTARIRFLSEIIHFLESNQKGLPTLVLIDELGTGTDPEEGAALGRAFLEYLLKHKVKVAVTTHFDLIKAFAQQHPDCKNVSLGFDPVALKPTYEVIDGLPGKSFGLDIARSFGLKEEITQQASKIVKGDRGEFADALKSLQAKRTELQKLEEQVAKKLAELSQTKAQLEATQSRIREENERRALEFQRLKEEFALSTEKFLSEIKSEIETKIKELAKGSSVKAKGEISRAIRTRRNDFIEDVDKKAKGILVHKGEELAGKGELAEGSIIKIPRLGVEGQVAELDWDKGSITILQAGRRIKLDLSSVKDEITRIHKTSEGKPASVFERKLFEERRDLGKRIDEEYTRKSLSTAHRLDLHGFTKDEALARLEKFISDAIYKNLDRIYILHGVGTGTIKRVVHEYLGGNRYVASFREATAEEGGKGTTVVDLK